MIPVDTPYGMTVGTQFNNSTSKFPAQLYSDAKVLGLSWLRGQCPWSTMEPTQGNYVMTVYDDFVANCNANGMLCYITIKQPPSFYLNQNVGGTNFPSPSGTATFAAFLANRYNGQNGFGLVNCIEIGNEDYTASTQATNGSTALANVLNSAATVIKPILPACKVGCGSINQSSIAFINTWYPNLYALTNASAMNAIDFMNLHWYPSNPHSDPTFSGGDRPSFSQAIGLIRTAIQNAGFNHPVWATETNWPVNTNTGRNAANVVTQALQWQYLQSELDTGRASLGACTHLFVYSLIYTVAGTPTSGIGLCDGMSLFQSNPAYVQAFASWQTYIVQYPQWNVVSVRVPATARRDASGFPAAARRNGNVSVTQRRG